METKTVEDVLKDDLKEKLKRMSALHEQRAMQEQILKNLNRELNGLEAVVAYIKTKLAENEPPR